MDKYSIKVNKVSKSFIIGRSEVHDTLRDSMMDFFHHPLSRIRDVISPLQNFWALKDVSFNVRKGEVLGIIGPNGSGKSTLLKIISRITPPTLGEISICGKVASLLEVGTGFHPELTGRENVYLNGAILGMTRKEINKRFDQIVDFAETDKFLDTPVKRYSSGMYMRLAFAVAAHLESDILLVDEVLAVGDAAFQKKCLGKMEEVRDKEGKTILFVSHNMGSIRELCTKGILLNHGKATYYDNVNQMINDHLNGKISGLKKEGAVVEGKNIIFSNFKLNDNPLSISPDIFSGAALEVSLDYRTNCSPKDLWVSLGIRSKKDNSLIVITDNHLEDIRSLTEKQGKVKAVLNVPKLSPGEYMFYLEAWLGGLNVIPGVEMGSFNIIATPTFATHKAFTSFPSLLMIDSSWTFSKT